MSYRTSKIYGNLSPGAGSTPGGATSYYQDQNAAFTGTNFVLTYVPTFIVGVFLNGQRLTSGVDYNVAGNTVTLTTAAAADSITVIYAITAAANHFVDQNTAFTGTNFVLTNAPTFIFGVFLNGARLTLGVDYTVAGNTVTLLVAAAADSITVVYIF